MSAGLYSMPLSKKYVETTGRALRMLLTGILVHPTTGDKILLLGIDPQDYEIITQP